ncbi:hypothetical protein D9758_003220 [Tetrapyrgos nigripes]|uniref:AAA+ ATPase domain-containing protein n=1 Tax=Tetrapyrgos nigripes TaxID=182062 RepID=A0A8H5LQB1_9AGAR|nr:hypothetical protein D9758_003220 [Tetrapyrgos nigripes]
MKSQNLLRRSRLLLRNSHHRAILVAARPPRLLAPTRPPFAKQRLLSTAAPEPPSPPPAETPSEPSASEPSSSESPRNTESSKPPSLEEPEKPIEPSASEPSSLEFPKDAESSKPRSLGASEKPTESSAAAASSSESPEDVASPKPPSSEEPEKPKVTRRPRQPASASAKDNPVLELPQELNILWSPEPDPPEGEQPDSTILPPPEIFEEILHNLLVTLHPQTQHRAAYSRPLGAPTEPTLALYCPIEGGDYIIDATVAELARRTGAEVLVLDAVQLAAGEWGDFGPAANSLQLPRNPLHFPSSSPRPTSTYSEDDDYDTVPPAYPQHVMLTVLAPSRVGGTSIVAPRRNAESAPPSRVKVFFDSLVNIRSKQERPDSSSTPNRPRLVYIRDFPTLSPSSSSWYPPLLSAVRQRRKGALSRESAPIANPMTIIFGITPPLVASPDDVPPSNDNSVLASRQGAPSSHISPNPKAGKNDWSESPAAEKARERRLRQRLKSWGKGDNVLLEEELPKLLAPEDDATEDWNSRSESMSFGSSILPSALSPSTSSRLGAWSSKNDDPSFFRTSILVPSFRSPSDERDCRVARRREINELTMRMGIGAIGGALEREGAYSYLSSLENKGEGSGHEKMWDNWGHKIESWGNVRRVADRTLGTVIASQWRDPQPAKPTLEPTVVAWPHVNQAWNSVNHTLDIRKTWLKDSLPSGSRQEEDEHDDEEAQPPDGYDEVIERVKNEDLNPHEQRLLTSIVDAASMTTTFNRVHLPPHTIDSVRSIVSLPLLHPEAFQHGILKEHAMTGCLLFGPPGTGKTLVVRALAKEAGCRMMVISPSDVMDMYVGEGEKLVRATFSLARKLSPCVIFLDELDALFGARTSNRDNGGAIAHRGVITEFMQEMDGLKSSKGDNVIVIGATNRPFDLDDAVLRRLPRRLLVDLPGEKEREEILKILLKDETLDESVDLKILAKKTESFSGSDLKHLCVSAALDSVKEHVKLPWITSSESETQAANSANVAASESLPQQSETADTSSDELIAVEATGQQTTDENREQVNDSQEPLPAEEDAKELPAPDKLHRIISQRNFDRALKEITPSSSETLGSLAELRKWNEEFGEGNKDRRKRLVWGKGRFGFNDRGVEGPEESGRVVPSVSEISAS